MFQELIYYKTKRELNLLIENICLSELEVKIVQYRLLECRPRKEVAHRVNISESTLDASLKRALRKIDLFLANNPHYFESVVSHCVAR